MSSPFPELLDERICPICGNDAVIDNTKKTNRAYTWVELRCSVCGCEYQGGHESRLSAALIWRKER